MHVAIRSALALAHLLPLLFLPFRRREERHGQALLTLYCVLSVFWGLAAALMAYGAGRNLTQIAHLAGYLSSDLAVLLVALLVPIARVNFGRDGGWIWGAVGVAWFLVAFGLHAYLGPEANGLLSATTIALAGWLIFSCLTIALSARWTLRAPLTFYRNRGTYWLGLLIPLLTGQGLVLIQQWREVGLALHLLGTASLTICIITAYLPNIKNLLRSAVGQTLLAAATALLYLMGLLVLLPLLLLQSTLYPMLIGAVVVAITLALVHHPFHSFIKQVVNRLLWQEEYDPAHTIREYGRTISNVIDLDLLATLAIGTIHEALEIKRGALMVAFTAEGHVSFRVIDGFGKARRRKVTLTVHSPILSYLALRGEPLFQYDLDRNPDLRKAPAKEKKQLLTTGMEVYLPILTQERLLGLLALGPQMKGEPYGPRELALLSTVAQQTAAALENARLFEKLRTLNTEITQLNQDLQRAYSKLKMLDQAKTDFLFISSHELRTPLTVIQGYTDILEELANSQVLTSERAVEITRSLREAIQDMAAVVTAMLDASAIESNALDLNLTSTLLQGVVSMAVGPWREAIEERQLELTVEGVEDIPPIEADVQWLCRALESVLSNAIKYTPDGGQISVRAKVTDDENFVEIVTTDTGIGIDPEHQDMIFEKFYRIGDIMLHSSGGTKFKGAGPGLGLYIARGVIEGHGGRIWVESEGYDEERCPGSAFHILLPLPFNPPAT